MGVDPHRALAGRSTTSLRRPRRRVELPVQVNGKLRDKVSVAPGLPQDEIEAIVMAQPKVQANLDGKQVVKVIHVGGRLVNIVVR